MYFIFSELVKDIPLVSAIELTSYKHKSAIHKNVKDYLLAVRFNGKHHDISTLFLWHTEGFNAT